MNKKRLLIIRRSAEILVVAGLYYITSRLGFLMAFPPGNFITLWPLSGLALMAVLIWGWQMGAGIFIGSLMVNFGTTGGAHALPVATAIATGSTLQAWAGAWLIEYFIKRRSPNTTQETLGNIENELNESKLLFHLLIESLPQNIYAKDINGRFVFANQHYCVTQGKSLDEIVGKTDFELHSPELAEKYRLDDQKVIGTGKTVEAEEVHAPIGENKFFAQVIKAPFYDSKGQTAGTLGIFWDITERKQSEELLRQQSEQLRILYEASQQLNRTLNLNEIYQAICDFMSSIASNDGLIISAFNPETQRITCRAYWLDNNWMDVTPFPSIPLEAEGKGTQSIVIRTGQPMLVNDYQAQVKTAQTIYNVNSETNEVKEEIPPEEEVTRSALIVPLKTGGTVTGVIQVMSYRLNAYTEDQLKLLEALALHIVSAEKNALLYAQVQAELNERKQAELLQETVYRIAESAQAAKSLEDLYPQIQHNISNVMYANSFYIALYDEASDLLRLVYDVDEVDSTKIEPFHPGKGLTGHVLRTGKSLLFQPEQGGLNTQIFGLTPKVWLGVPLIVQGKTIGVMAVQHYFDEKAYTEREQHILEFVSSQVATAIDRKQTEESVRVIEKRNSAIIENAPDGIVLLDSEGRFMFASPSAYRMFGYTPTEVIGFDPAERMHPDDAPLVLGVINRSQMDPAAVFTLEYRFLHKDGSYRWLESTYSNLFAEPGVNAMVINFRDITEIKTAQRELEALNRDLEKRVEERTAEVRRSEATYRALFENSNDGIFLLSPKGEELRANQHALDMVGYTAEEYATIGQLQKNPFTQQPDQRQDADNRFDALLRGENVPLYERTFTAKDGKKVEVEINLSAIRDISGKIVLAQSVVRDITERKRAEKLLRESSELFSEFMLHSPIFTYIKEVTPTQGRVLYASENFTEMIGLPGNQMVGKTTSELFQGEFAQKIIADDWAVISNNELITLDEELNGRNYTTIKFPILQGERTLLAGYTIDITERKKAGEALRDSRDKLSAANAALEKASRLKDEFLASMSHELRTPLTGILGLSEALQLQVFGTLNEKQLKSLKNIENSGRHLLDLINDILDLSKIEAGKLDMEFGPCSAADICNASLQLMKGMAHQKRQNIDFRMIPVSISIRADARRLKQMLVNLLSNAVKFTPEGGGLGLEVYANESEKAVYFSVWDKGIGIKPEEIGKLFKPFIQLDSSLARQYSGTGLGLSLVQRMAELHGGSVKIESIPGEGSRFTIILPWSAEITQPVHSLKERDTGLLLKNTLIIEDNILDAEHVTRHLKEIGIMNIIHPVMQGALEKAASLRPGVILLDLHLSDGFGLDLLAQLKADNRTRDIPIVITSVEERRSEAMKLGAIGYLVKPFTQKDLRTELIKAAAFIAPIDSVMVIAAPTSIPLVMIADDNELILEMITDFLEANGYRVIAARNGFELLERAPELHPDIMLVDIQMPGIDGMETMRRIRAHHDPITAATPIIAITALAMTGDREKCLAAGANEYISKPIVLKKLIGSINQFLKKKTG